jgi:hypothetical protein
MSLPYVARGPRTFCTYVLLYVWIRKFCMCMKRQKVLYYFLKSSCCSINSTLTLHLLTPKMFYATPEKPSIDETKHLSIDIFDTLSFEISNGVFLSHATLLLVCAIFLVRILTFVSVVSKHNFVSIF